MAARLDGSFAVAGLSQDWLKGYDGIDWSNRFASQFVFGTDNAGWMNFQGLNETSTTPVALSSSGH